MKKYLIVTLLLAVPVFIGLSQVNNSAKQTETGSSVQTMKDNKKTSEITANNQQKTGTNPEVCDSMLLSGKIWMMRQNIILDY